MGNRQTFKERVKEINTKYLVQFTELQHLRTARVTQLNVRQASIGENDIDFQKLLKIEIEKEQQNLQFIIKIVYYLERLQYHLSTNVEDSIIKQMIDQDLKLFRTMYNTSLKLTVLQEMIDEYALII